MKTKAQKQKDLEALTEQFKNAKAAMLVGFQKMTVAKDQELRNQAARSGCLLRSGEEHAGAQGFGRNARSKPRLNTSRA